MRCLSALLLALPCLALPAHAQTACGTPQTAIGWSQPPRHPVESPDAVRWPIDATLRIAYGGNGCPDLSQLELYAEDGTLVPAQVRLRSPYNLVGHDALPITVIEVDPVQLLVPRTTYSLIWRAPEPKLESFARFEMTFKTLARTMHPLPVDDFEGILSVAPREGMCSEEFGPPVVISAAIGPNGCETGDRAIVRVRFTPINRRDVIYAVTRTSSTPDVGEAETDPVLVALVGGNEDIWLQSQSDALVPIAVPVSPGPRTDCFRVQMVDAQGEMAGGDGEACVRLPDDIACIEDYREDVPVLDPLVSLGCFNLGLNGADPYAVPPPEGVEPDDMPEPDVKSSASSGCCRVAPGSTDPRAPWELALVLLWLSRPRRSRRA
ncbi:MAG: hypothetical protein ACI9U2_004248 [Bradymonadia bacterium]|jgi:hypothetical protein